jgi:hypothetical protein
MLVPTARRLRRAALATFAACALAACGESGAPAEPTAALAPGREVGHGGPPSSPVVADYVMRGLVVGVDSASRWLETQRPLGGTTITVIQVVRDGAASDSSARLSLVPRGTVTAAADGTFELADVPNGYFYLDAVPPTGSGFRGGRAGSISFPKASGDRALVYLYR